MIYLSKGIVKENSTEHLLQLARCGQERLRHFLQADFGYRDFIGSTDHLTMK